MTQSIRCMHCGTKTRLEYQPVRERHNGKIILLTSAPMHFCPKCIDNLISLEALAALRYIKTLPLNKGINEFSFNDIYPRAAKAII
ncbi:MAG: hypothetical protein N3I35_05235 [Clostridia bacterium]|nr:hypothetical protein [Clostridia bacterium]